MKLLPRSLRVAALLTLALHALAIDRLPIEDFAREPDTNRVRLSPNGTSIAFVREHSGVPTLHVSEIATGKMTRINLGQPMTDIPALQGRKRVYDFDWVSDERLVIVTAVRDSLFGMFSANRDGSRSLGLSGWEKGRVEVGYIQSSILHVYGGGDPSILTIDMPNGPTKPNLLKVNTVTGDTKTLAKNPGDVAYWGVDLKGVPRFGLTASNEQSGAIYRDGDKGEWKTILPMQNRRGQLRVVGFDAAKGQILVTKLNEQKRWAVYPLDPKTGAFGEALLSNPEYDVVPDRGIDGVGGIAFASTFFSQWKQTLAGIRYSTEAPRVKWFDRDYAQRQAGIDRALPNTVNLLVDETQDASKQLWFAFSDQDPGSYHLLDVEKKSFQPIAPRMSWIKPAQMASMSSVKYQARDGLLIHGYLTIPVGHEPKNLPLVVMPHGGPWARDTWGYNPMVQLLANRGYAVLQMNYRGSTGYGDELFQQAKREIGGKIQDDIEDATRWAISAGVADPERIAIFGMSYGGYSALFALGHNPELYRCGISAAGVTDWPGIYKESDATNNKAARSYWREQIGDPGTDMARLAAISPVNFADKIVAPVLIIQGEDDQRVPEDQAKRMIAALARAGHPPEQNIVKDLGHSFGSEKQRLKLFQQIVTFLEKNLGPGVQ